MAILTYRVLAATCLVAMLPSISYGHSWCDDLQVVSAPMTGQLGYIRGYEGHNDAASSYRIIKEGMPLCKSNQMQPVNTPNFPRLKAQPGQYVTCKYTENGHVSRIEPQPGANPGKIYWYGTTDGTAASDTLEVVRKWNRNGTGGDKRGKRLMRAQNFDDGRCVEPGHPELGRTVQPCQSVFKIPEDLKPGSTYTVYWVWDYSDHFGTNSVFEWYTSCMDIDIVAPKSKREVHGHYRSRQHR